jgi:selenocysteine lyase/cysteine desulfurase
VLGVAGLKAGLEFVREKSPHAIWKHESDLIARLVEFLQKRGDYTIYGHLDESRRVGTLSFNHPSMDSIDLGGILDTSFNIAVRPGMHCAPYIHKALGTAPKGTVRISPGVFNTPDDIDCFTDALAQVLG